MKRSELVKKLKDEGWTVLKQGSRHEVWESPDGGRLPIPNSSNLKGHVQDKLLKQVERGGYRGVPHGTQEEENEMTLTPDQRQPASHLAKLLGTSTKNVGNAAANGYAVNGEWHVQRDAVTSDDKLRFPDMGNRTKYMYWTTKEAPQEDEEPSTEVDEETQAPQDEDTTSEPGHGLTQAEVERDEAMAAWEESERKCRELEKAMADFRAGFYQIVEDFFDDVNLNQAPLEVLMDVCTYQAEPITRSRSSDVLVRAMWNILNEMTECNSHANNTVKALCQYYEGREL